MLVEEVENVTSIMDFNLKAFQSPTYGSFMPLVFQPSAMTNYVNQCLLLYLVKLLSQHIKHQ